MIHGGHEHVFLPIAHPLPSTENSTLMAKDVRIPIKKKKRRGQEEKKKKGRGGKKKKKKGPQNEAKYFKNFG